MRLDEFLTELERDREAERQELAAERSYEVTDYLADFESRFESVADDGNRFGSASPSVFVGRSNYPQVSAGVLSPVGNEDTAAEFITDSSWYDQDIGIADVFQRRSALLTANQSVDVRSAGKGENDGQLPNVHDTWSGFLGVQREVAIAAEPVKLELGLADHPSLGFDVDAVREPTGPWATVDSARVRRNPSVPTQIEKTLEDDDWKAEGAMTYLYRRDFDVYDIHRILSAGTLGQSQERRLVPTRWSITAVDDTIGSYLRGQIRSAWDGGGVEVWHNEFLGNAYWVIIAPGSWEYELVEIKAPGSVWNPRPEGEVHMGADAEGFNGRSSYVEETAGAYHAARLGVLEYLDGQDRQAKVIVIRHVSDEYWGPVGVWQIRESVRNAFTGEPAQADSIIDAVTRIAEYLPTSLGELRRKSELLAGQQTSLTAFRSSC